MQKTILLGLVLGVVTTTMIASSLIPAVEAGKCNPQGNSIGDPHGFNNPTGNPHDEDDDEGGNPHGGCGNPDNPPGNGQD